MQVPILDLKRQYTICKKEIEEAIKSVFEKCNFILGEEVSILEKKFSAYCGCKYAVAVASGTDALELTLRALGVGFGDEVITSPFSYIATSVAISNLGAKPVFVDIDPRTYTIDITKIEKAITKKTKAILPVHIYGHPANMEKINDLAKKHNLKVVEDACQAHGAEFNGKKVGGLGHAGCFSFYPSKNLGAYGDGGIVTTNDESLSEKIRIFRNCGRKSKYEHIFISSNSRLDTIQAAILLVKLRHLEEATALRRKHAAMYNGLLNDIKKSVQLPFESKDVRHVYHLYAIQISDRHKVAQFLQDKGISTLMHYPIPIHLEPAYEDYNYKKGDFPVAEALSERVLSLPMFPELTDIEIKYVSEKLKEAIKLCA
ncbi:MAG: hypothetical protein COZ98_01915 [Candidatus Omnitrophica bacterium CG_4_8_14_3_um_filter_43_15]|nr:MAG: hypothetical protein AUJ89_05195 [Candidatus Omnitrophica bacterium CG1_02_43_210]PIW80523.1 MAG: hypothetical protein COZ98_01915 [Candidatus Omnitrophica bacterium CG_4_8_14_3_um_filter_43_15]PIY83989.1 MAG: hypothetical protein COY77_04440 [Candidatus Omnitrophica bacterium CG_4_10_14_0_8_um_filter_43_18]